MNPMTVNGEKWTVSLSDGSSYSEDDPILCSELQRVSPWSKLQEILVESEVYITQLRVHVLGRTYAAPSRSDRSRFPSSTKPINYMCIRRMGIDALSPSRVASHYIGMQYELPTGMKITTWIDIYNGDTWEQIA